MVSSAADKKLCFCGFGDTPGEKLHWGQRNLNNQNMGDGKHLKSTSLMFWEEPNKLLGKPLSKIFAIDSLQRLSGQGSPLCRKRWSCKPHLALISLNLHCTVLLRLWLWTHVVFCLSLLPLYISLLPDIFCSCCGD